MIITKLSAQVKNPDRVNIYVDGKYSFSLSLDQLLQQKLKQNQELDDAALKKLKQLSSDGKLKMRTLEWLLLRPRSARELKDYLRRKDAGDELTTELVTYFQSRGYQNDAAFARWWVEQRRTNKQRSARYISQELAGKGVPREIIAEVVNENQTADIDTLRILVAKKQKSTRYANDEQKFVEYLLRQGYNYSLIKEVLAE